MNRWQGIISFLLIVVVMFGFSPIAIADELSPGAYLFEVHCAGCHINGGNIIRRGKNLRQKALEKNGYGSVEAIAQIVTNGKNNMSAYGDRLTPEQIQAVSSYVLEQAQQGWK
ncbi:MAG: c-type cytochrome [Leptolyngbyaceae cyanobacterium SL_7_1]|nr:c-type cytochrome [Leptolyngbyaceae cyanobacterium SL_7_1]